MEMVPKDRENGMVAAALTGMGRGLRPPSLSRPKREVRGENGAGSVLCEPKDGGGDGMRG